MTDTTSNPESTTTTASKSNNEVTSSQMTSGSQPSKSQLDPERKDKLVQLLERLQMQTGDSLPPEILQALKQGSFKESERVHQFWNTQPVPQTELTVDVQPGPIHEDVPLEKIRQGPYPLPKDFEWCDVDIEDASQMEQLYTLLNLNYNEDSDGMFRFDYSKEFLSWALKPPGYKKSWHVGVRVAASKKLVAFISAIPVEVRVLDSVKHMVEINFLCVHKKIRSKRLAPVLIKEITRRSHLSGIFQAVYTAGTRIPTPIVVCPYFHRTLNPKKLIDVGFTSLPRGMSLARRVAQDSLPANPPISLRLMESKDIPRVRELYNNLQSNWSKLAPVFDNDAMASHWLEPVSDVLWTYVAENSEGLVTDFVSFYRLDSSVLQHSTHKKVNAAYLYYYGTSSQEKVDSKNSEQNPKDLKVYQDRLTDLVQSALVHAKKLGFDVFNGLNCVQNSIFLSKLKFSQGDGSLNYYLFNWNCPPIEPHEVGLIMV